jgi:hypothetical protein
MPDHKLLSLAAALRARVEEVLAQAETMKDAFALLVPIGDAAHGLPAPRRCSAFPIQKTRTLLPSVSMGSGSQRAAGDDPENKRATRARCSGRTQDAERRLM